MRLVLLTLSAVLATAQQDHSRHQHGVAGLGTVEFPTSCNAMAQDLISRAAALLHSFGYEESRMAFNDAAKADPTCSIAYWGVARTWYHPIWAPPSPDELKQGAAALDRATNAKTDRERDYINALAVFYKDWKTVDHVARAKNYEQALALVCERHPSDDEAAIFHALQLVAIGYLDPADKTYKWQRKGSEILNQLLPRHQNHPGVAHYIIHSVDYPPVAELGLKAARAYARIAPDSPHALHMPSHIFTRLGLWDDSIASNTASTTSAIAQAQRLHGGGGAFDQLHAMDYLVYAYLQQAKDTSAQKVLAEMEGIARLDENQFAAAYAFAASPARWALERHDWKGAAALEVKPAWFPWNRFRNAEALVHYARAIGAARAGDAVAARRSTDEIAAIRKAMPATRDYDWSGSIGAQWEAATALIALAEGKKHEGLGLLRMAADHEDTLDKHPVTPGALLPVREMLADLLLENGAASEALKEYEAVLKTAPRRFNATAGAAKAAGKAGDDTKARAYAMQLREIASNAENSRPELEWARVYAP
ncbi:MAG: repeat protein [Bryobacterales bacterium]|nr:repeat protein [Bryobacterales bacterium]